MFMEGFRTDTGYRGPLYTDPSLAVYEAAHLERGVGTVLNPLAAVNTIRALARGARQVGVHGDKWQQGGALVIAPGGVVKWHHVSKRPGDNARMEQIVAALKAS